MYHRPGRHPQYPLPQPLKAPALPGSFLQKQPGYMEHYRQRGTAEGYLGELMNVLRPALSSSPRPKGHYRGKEPRKRCPSG